MECSSGHRDTGRLYMQRIAKPGPGTPEGKSRGYIKRLGAKRKAHNQKNHWLREMMYYGLLKTAERWHQRRFHRAAIG